MWPLSIWQLNPAGESMVLMKPRWWPQTQWLLQGQEFINSFNQLWHMCLWPWGVQVPMSVGREALHGHGHVREQVIASPWPPQRHSELRLLCCQQNPLIFVKSHGKSYSRKCYSLWLICCKLLLPLFAKTLLSTHCLLWLYSTTWFDYILT